MNFLTRLLSFLFAVILLNGATVNAQETQFRSGPAHTGLYAATGNLDAVSLRWLYKTNGAIRSTPVVANGRVFFGSADHYLYCLDTTGKQLWKYEAADAVSSSPAVANGMVFFNDRSNNLYAIKASNGTLAWSKQLGKTLAYDWGFDYYVASPLVVDKTVYTGSGDGNMYAVAAQNGNIKWQYSANAIIRSTPSFHNGKLFFGDFNSRVYSINAADGELNWVFKTNGDTSRCEDYGFDRKAVVAAPAVSNNVVVVGDRAGFLYGINETTGEKIWDYDYHISWVLSSVAIKDSIVVTGTSDAAFINALNLYTGKEIWEFQTQGPVWASPVITGNNVICPSNDGVLYGMDLYTGKELWRYSTNEKFFSSPVIAGDKLYAANDDGTLYCFSPAIKKTGTVHKAVFWMKDPPFQYFQYGVDKYIRDYFRSNGYEMIDDKSITTFLQSRITDHEKSVVVFATDYFPPSITGDSTHTGLLLNYLKAGGKTVICGMNPLVYVVDTATKQITALDFTVPKQLLGIMYPHNDTRAFNGYYPSTPTKEGMAWGLKTNYVARMGQPDGVADIALMRDESGKATSWVKTYGGPAGTGFVQTWLYPSTLNKIDELKSLAEYGL